MTILQHTAVLNTALKPKIGFEEQVLYRIGEFTFTRDI